MRSKDLAGFDKNNALHTSWARSFSKQRYHAQRMGKQWDIDLEYAWQLINSQNWCCALTGVKFTPTGTASSTQPSLDRIDSTQGYLKHNVQYLTYQVNLSKRETEQDQFILMCEQILAHKKLVS